MKWDPTERIMEEARDKSDGNIYETLKKLFPLFIYFLELIIIRSGFLC